MRSTCNSDTTKMSDVDGVPLRLHDAANAGADPGSPSFADSTRHSRTKAFSRDSAMNRDRSRESHDDSRGRGRPQHTRRGYASSTQPRLRSPSGFRSSQNHRSREKKYHGGEAYRDNGERRVDERRRSRSLDHHGHYHDDTHRGKSSPAQDSVSDSRKRYDGTPSPRQYSKAHDYSEYAR